MSKTYHSGDQVYCIIVYESFIAYKVNLTCMTTSTTWYKEKKIDKCTQPNLGKKAFFNP